MVSEETVRASFAYFENANCPAFLENVADNVSWTVMGTNNPFQGHYTSKAEIGKAMFTRLIPKLATPLTAKVTNVLVIGDWAVVEIKGSAMTKGGKDYDQELCWITRYDGDKIAEVRIYLDSALVKAVLDE